MADSPPPLFKQGVSTRVRAVIFVLAAFVLLTLDSRLQTLQWMRLTVESVLYPIQQLALIPRDAWHSVSIYFLRQATLEQENAQLKQQALAEALAVQQAKQLRYENAQLRQLLAFGDTFETPTLMATILYDVKNSASRRVVVNRGRQHGVALGHPVIDDKGLVGQVTRVFPLMAEITLLTDKEHATPIQVQRTGLRAVLYGTGHDAFLNLRLSNDADIKIGDILVTSGMDGIYPARLSVAEVASMKPASTSGLKEVACRPIAGLRHHRDVLILLVQTNIPMPLGSPGVPKKINRKITRDTFLSLGPAHVQS